MPRSPVVTVTVDGDEVTDVTEYFNKHKKFRRCRKFGHAFEPTHEHYFREPDSGALYQRLKCLRDCGLTATDTWHPKTMERIGNRKIDYENEPDYLAKGRHISRLDLRLWERDTRSARPEPTKTGRRKRAG